MKWLLVALLAFAAALLPAAAFAQEGSAKEDDFLLRIRSDVVVPQGETIGTLVVIDGNAVIDGEVTHGVFVINGDATVTGRVGGDLTVISGDIDLQSTAQVKNVNSIRGDITRSDGAVVTGTVHERDTIGFAGGVAAIFSLLAWLGFSIAMVTAGLVFAAVGGRQLTEAAERMTGDAVNTIIGAVFVAVALPALATLAFVTLIGIPLGISIVLFLLPALGLLGYITAGTRLGLAITGRGGSRPQHPYAATAVGMILLQLLLLVPVIGIIVALFLSLWGAGALAFGAYRAAGGKGFGGQAPAPTPQPAAG